MTASALPAAPTTIKPLVTLRPPSTSRAWQTAPHPSLPIVATASSDKSVRVYSLTSFTLLVSITGGHKRSVRACAWKPGTRGESVLATGSFDASAGIWRKWELTVEEADFTQSKKTTEAGNEVDEEEDDDDFRFTVLLDGHESEIKSVAWNAGGQYLATCSRDKSVWIWEEIEDDNFETVAVLQEHDADVKCVAWHPQEDLLASASYDDSVRLYKEEIDDWICVSLLSGHSSTVWCVQFEPAATRLEWLGTTQPLRDEQKQLLDSRAKSGPRLASCSDDRTIRIWRRLPKERDASMTGQGRITSILRSTSAEEEWIQEAFLPERHERAIYSISWSARTGMIVSAGSDGKIIVYREQWAEKTPTAETTCFNEGADHVGRPNGEWKTSGSGASSDPVATEWVVFAELESAHDVFEVNHVTWAQRRDKGRRSKDEEIIVSTGDDGEVKVWTLEDG